MPVVYLIHSPDDRAFVEKRLICPLPALGFDRWISGPMIGPASGPSLPQAAIGRCAAILVVVPATASVSNEFRSEVESVLTCPAPVIPVYLGARNTTPPDPVLERLQKLGGLDARAAKEQPDPRELSNLLAPLMPRPRMAAESGHAAPDFGAPIGWNEELFSAMLA
jgi:hypothetical protein